MSVDVQCNYIYKCKSVDYTLLIIPREGFRFYGAFAFQVLFGRVKVNGYECVAKKFNPRHLLYASAAIMDVALHITPLKDQSCLRRVDHAAVKASLDSLVSRIRALIDDSFLLMSVVSKMAFDNIPVAVVVVKHEMDVASRFIAQQYAGTIFKAPSKSVCFEIGRSCYLLPNHVDELLEEENAPRKGLYHQSEMCVINGALDRVDRVGESGEANRVMIVGKKGAGKSTLLHYLANRLLNMKTKPEEPTRWMKRVFVLDCDVGQSELTPSGVISLHEITEPFLGVAFSRQVSTLCNAYFFGSPNPSVDFVLYKRLVKMAFDDYLRISGNEGRDSVLLINTLGWIEDLGYDLLIDLLKALSPSLLINIVIDGALSFEVPSIYQLITTTLRRAEMNSVVLETHSIKPAVLRAFSIAGYLAQCFRGFGSSTNSEYDLISHCTTDMRLMDMPAYRVRFSSIAIYVHPELPPVDDTLILSAMNCAIVGLCDVIEDEKEPSFKRNRFLNDERFPHRLTLNKKRRNNVGNDDNNNKNNKAQSSATDWRVAHEESEANLPLLRCYGYAMIRAVDPEQKIFYLITPVDVSILKERVTVLAVGHELQATSILFDGKGKEPAPYLVEFERTVSDSHRKLLSPLTNIKPHRLGKRTANHNLMQQKMKRNRGF